MQTESYLRTCVSRTDDNTEYRMLSEKFMTDLGKLIPTDWEKLGIELEVNSEKMKELRSKCTTDVSCWAKEMLFKWTEIDEDNIQLMDLCEGLNNVGRNDLVQVVREAFPGDSQLPSCTQELQKLFQKLADKLSTEWFRLGIELEVPSDDLDKITIDTEPAKDLDLAFDMLKFWNKEFTGPSRLEVLKTSLRECHRNDIVRWIEERQGQISYVFARPRSARRSVDPDLHVRLESMQMSDVQSPLRSHVDSVDQSCRNAEQVHCQPHAYTPSSYNSDTTNPCLVTQEGFDEIDNSGRTPNEHDENDSGCCSSISSQRTEETFVRLDSMSEDGDKNINLPGGLNVPKILTGKTSADSICGEYILESESIAYSTTSR